MLLIVISTFVPLTPHYHKMRRIKLIKNSLGFVFNVLSNPGGSKLPVENESIFRKMDLFAIDHIMLFWSYVPNMK